jgi:hypothetical protein
MFRLREGGAVKIKLSLPLLLLLGASPAWAQSDAGGALRPMLEKRYAELKTAMAERDPQALSALLAPDFVSEDISGKATSAGEMIKELGALPKDSGRVAETSLLSIKPRGDLAIVEQLYQMTTTKALPDGSKQAIELVTLSTDTWTRSGGRWLLRKTVTHQVDYTVDGKLVAHKVRQ